MNTFSKVCGCDHLHNNSSVVAEENMSFRKRKENVFEPNKITTRKSGPNPHITAECPYPGVISAGRVTCRMMEKHFICVSLRNVYMSIYAIHTCTCLASVLCTWFSCTFTFTTVAVLGGSGGLGGSSTCILCEIRKRFAR